MLNAVVEAPAVQPFGINFAVPQEYEQVNCSTSMSSDDTGSYRKDTDDHDT